ncbi:MAG: hypothetical protein ACK5PF_03365, partial [bacterium]
MASPATAVTHRRTDSTHSLEGRKSRFSRHANWNGRILADGSPLLEDGNTLAGDGEGKPATCGHEAGQLPEEDARMAPSRMGCACLETGTFAAGFMAPGHSSRKMNLSLCQYRFSGWLPLRVGWCPGLSAQV